MGNGYMLPEINGEHIVGASYTHHCTDLRPNPDIHQRLLRQASVLRSGLDCNTIVSSRASFRTSTHHRLPYIGPIVKADSFSSLYHDLQRGYPESRYSTPEFHPSLYITAGHGSRGLISSLAAGELLANYIFSTTPIFGSTLRGELNPASYLTKKMYSRPTEIQAPPAKML